MDEPMEQSFEGQSLTPPRRSWRNYLLKPILQLQLGVYTIGLTVLFSSVLIGVIYLTFERIYELVLDLTPLGAEVIAILNEYICESSGWLAAVVVLYMLANITLTVVFTHKMVGPTVAFRRHIRKLIEGDFSTRLNLRRGDAFVELADELNMLAQKLDESAARPNSEDR